MISNWMRQKFRDTHKFNFAERTGSGLSLPDFMGVLNLRLPVIPGLTRYPVNKLSS